MFHHWSFRLALPLVIAFAVPGCQSGSGVDVSVSTPDATEIVDANSPPDSDVSPRGVIGYSALDLANPFFNVIAEHLTEAAREAGFEVVVEDASSDVKKQSEHVDSFIAQQVAAIVLNPCDGQSSGPAIKKANEAGIPVFTCDLQCNAEGAEVVAHVGTDNHGGGKLAGEAMIEALGEQGGKVFIVHFPQAESCQQRVNGFKEVIEAHNAGRETGRIEIVGEQDGGGNPNDGFSVTSAAIQSDPDLAGVFAINDPSGLGAYAALEQAGKTDQVTIVAFDGQRDGKQAILDGKIYADPIQFPDQMGRQTVDNILRYQRGEKGVPVQLIETRLYRQQDAQSDPELQ